MARKTRYVGLWMMQIAGYALAGWALIILLVLAGSVLIARTLG